MKAFPVGLNPSGKTKYKICSYDVDHIDRRGDTLYPVREKVFLPYSEHITEYIEIPCGKCESCRLDYARTWADRCMLEGLYHDQSYFVTLTYDPLYLPHSSYVDETTGEICEAATLRKKDMQNFMKRLRKHFEGVKIRFYGCGEYGGRTMRPHYHMILFGVPLDDLKQYKSSGSYIYYNSLTLDKIWNQGYVVISDLTYASAAYTARYVVKKAGKHDKERYEKLNIEPEFVLMSRRPGIAKQYFDDHPDLYDYDYFSISTPEGGKNLMPSRYFDKQLEKVDPETYAILKEKRKEVAENKTIAKLRQTDADYLDMLESEELNQHSRVQSLSRDRIL